MLNTSQNIDEDIKKFIDIVVDSHDKYKFYPKEDVETVSKRFRDFIVSR